MIRKFVTVLFLIPLAAVIVLIGVANRQSVTIALDPTLADRPAVSVAVPLFPLVLGVLIAGVVVGGAAAWSGQRKWRRAARRSEAEATALRREAEDLRQRLKDVERALPPSASMAAIAYRRPPAA